MNEHNPLDRILLSDDGIAPSSGFTARVMEAIEEDARQQPPLPFPWGRLIVGVIATVGTLAAGFWLALGFDLSPLVSTLAGAGLAFAYAAAAIGGTLMMMYAPYLWAVAQRRRVPARSR